MFSTPIWFPAHSGRCDLSAHHNLHNSNLHVPISKRTSTTSTPLHRMEVVMDVVSEHRLTPLQLGGEDSCINADKQLHESSNGLNCDDDIERGI
jgi:hypothetical protein